MDIVQKNIILKIFKDLNFQTNKIEKISDIKRFCGSLSYSSCFGPIGEGYGVSC